MVKALSVRNLSKTYSNNVKALQDISFDVEQGDFLALLGPNGAGKSTAIGIITSLVNKTEGHVEVMGKSLDKQLAEAKQFIGLVPQEFNFNQFERVIDILIAQAGFYGVPKKLAIERAEKYLGKLDLWDKRLSKARELSGGMKRRLMIARALIHEPEVLILDEPTAGVDIELRRSMWTFLQDMNAEGKTIILTTHYLEEAEHLCRTIAIIDKGKLIEHCDMKALLGRLDKETFVLDVVAEKAELDQLVVDDAALDGIVCRVIDSATLEVDIAKQGSLNHLFEQLTAQNIKVMSLRNKVNRLEELFVSLVDESLT